MLGRAVLGSILLLLILSLGGFPARAEWLLEYRTGNTRPSFLCANGTTWFGGSDGGRSLIAEINPSAEIIRRYYLPNETDIADLVLGPELLADGPLDLSYVWFLQRESGKIGRLNPEDGKWTEWVIPTQNAKPTGIVISRHRNGAVNNTVFFTEHEGGKIGSLRYVSGEWVFREFPIPSENAKPVDIAVDENGYVWFTESQTSKIGKLDPWKGSIAEYRVDEGGQPWGIAVDSENMIWFVMSQANRIARLNPHNGWYDTFEIPTTRSRPRYIEADRRGSIWFTEFDSGKAGRFLPNNTAFVEYALPDANAGPDQISVANTTGEVWISEVRGNRIARILIDMEVLDTAATRTAATGTASQVTSPATASTTSITGFTETTTAATIMTTTTTLTAASTATMTISSTTTVTMTTTQPASTVTHTFTTVMTTSAPKLCAIASAAYGSEIAEPVRLLREHRDKNIVRTFAGYQFMRVFEQFYYSFSPTVAKIIENNQLLRVGTRLALSPMVSALHVGSIAYSACAVSSEVAAVGSGILSCTLIGILYLLPTVLAISLVRLRNKRETRKPTRRRLSSFAHFPRVS